MEDVPESVITLDGQQVTRNLAVDAAGNVTNLTISVDFMKHDSEDCLVAPEDYSSYPDEIGIALESPSGTIVNLVKPWLYHEDGTYSDWQAVPSLVNVTFNDNADELVGIANNGVPTTGAFKPVEPLSAFLGQTAQGIWKLHVQDAHMLDATCYYGALLNVETDYREPTTIALASTSFDVAVGEDFTLTAVVSPESEGFVAFSSNGVLLGTAPVEHGIATLILHFAEAGEFEVVAEYLGHEDFEGSLSNTVSVTASQAAGEEDGQQEETPAKTDPEVTPKKDQLANTGGTATGLAIVGFAALSSGAGFLLLRRKSLHMN